MSNEEDVRRKTNMHAADWLPTDCNATRKVVDVTRFIPMWLRAIKRTISTGQIAATKMGLSYEAALEELNGLQSNAQVIEALRASRGSMNSRSIPEMREYVRRLGYKVSDLDTANVIHVTGTKGKGSTCAFAERILRDLGYKTGLYTSPHLVEVRERIRVNGVPLSRDQFAKYFFETRDKLLQSSARDDDGLKEFDVPTPLPTYFRFLTLMAFHVFMSEKVDAAVLEVGIGGSYDATNVIERPAVTGITSIGIDHQALLGNTRAEIAQHKSGIMKPGVAALSVEQLDDAAQVVAQRATELKVKSFEFVKSLNDLAGFEHVATLGLPGSHQLLNAGLAVALCQKWLAQKGRELSPQVLNSMAKSLAVTSWPGRCQTIQLDNLYMIDGAHTPESMEAMVRWYTSELSKASEPTTRVLVFNCTHDRSSAILLKPLAQVHLHTSPFAHVAFCPNVVSSQTTASDLLDKTSRPDLELNAQHANASTWKELVANGATPVSSVHVFQDLEQVVRWTRTLAPTPVRVLVVGSLHLAGAATAALQNVYNVDLI